MIGSTVGHGENENTAAQLVSHAILGAALAYVNGGDPAAGGSAAVASEAAAKYIANQYNDGKTAINPETGKFDPNLLPESTKASIRDLTSAIGAAVGGTVGDSAFNAQLAGVVGKNAVENNELDGRSLPIDQRVGQGYESLIKYAQEQGLSKEETEKRVREYGQPEDWQGKEYVEGLAKGSVEAGASVILPELVLQKIEPVANVAIKSKWFSGIIDTVKGWFGKEDNVVSQVNNANTTSIGKEGLLDNLASQMQKPLVEDGKLQNIANDLYRENAKIGNGSTGAAVRYENETGGAVGSKFHTQKAEDYSVALKDWINRNPNASTNDKMAAELMLRDLQNALNGK